MRKSEYKERALVEEFKRKINEVIRRKLIKMEMPFIRTEQWYICTTNLNKH